MSDAPQIPVQETRAEDVKPLELHADSAAPTTNVVEPVLPTEEKTAATEPVTLPEQTATEPTTGVTAEEPLKEERNGVEPVTAGVLGYKAPGLLKQFIFSKRFFWIGDEAVSSKHLSNYLRGTEPRAAQHAAAWSSHTGKGLLYMVKNESEKSHPQEVLCLADIHDLEKHSPLEFSFKISGEKHTFKAATDAERDGWYQSIENGIAQAKETKEGVMSSDKYQETLKHLSAPATIGAAGVAGVKAHEHKKDEAKDENAAVDSPVEQSEQRTDSAGEEVVDAKKKENKSRSQSRKRNSIFGALKGKKEEHDVKSAVKKEEKEEKKEEKKEAKEEKKEAKAEEKAEAKDTTHDHHAAEAAAVGGTAAAGTAIAAEEPKTTETVEEPKVESNAQAKPKRNSIFGSIYQKVRSPASEKKESEVMPVIAPKEETKAVDSVETPKESPEAFIDAPETTEAPLAETKAEEAAAPVAATGAATVPVTEEPKQETAKVGTPKKEKESFLGGLLSKARAKSPAARKSEEKREVPTAATDAPPVPPKDEARSEAAAPTTTEPTAQEIASRVIDAPLANTNINEAEAKKEEPIVDQEVKTTTPSQTRRRSYFGSLGQKKEKTEGEVEGEKPAGKFSSMFRKPSQAARSNKKENVAPVETAATESTPTEAAVPEATAPEATAEDKPVEASAQPQSIGDVGPESISVGQPQTTGNQTVSASA